jgi:hypothetical protein
MVVIGSEVYQIFERWVSYREVSHKIKDNLIVRF